MPSKKKQPISFSKVDFSTLSQQDIENLILQRSSSIEDHQVIRSWMAGDPTALSEAAVANRNDICRISFDEIKKSYEVFRLKITEINPRRVADIGAGNAFVDLMIYNDFGCDLLLIDIEASENRHFGFKSDGAGYASLAQAKAFLMANVVPENKIQTINPEKNDIKETGNVDFAVSLISCGYHYPAQTYDNFFREQLSQGGGLVLDIRKGSKGLNYLRSLGKVEVLEVDRNRACTFVEKTPI